MDHRLRQSIGDVWMQADDCSLEEFRNQVEDSLSAEDVPFADEIVSNIPVYDGAEIRRLISDADGRKAVMAEWNRNFLSGSGILFIRRAFEDKALVDAVTGVFNEIISHEEAASAGKGDHFAPAGANSRVWNSHEKLCVRAPELFTRYYSNDMVSLASQAWLGPLYQITSQVNVVRPGGKAQTCHRDYHMGFLKKSLLELYPAVAHQLSASLTLQGAVAHSDMPLESGPTKLLPFSQRYQPGYLAAHQPEFQDYFESNFVSIALEKGDAGFFNPATFHAAGENTTSDVHRFANLMQIGSAFGRSIEIVDRARISAAVYPVLKTMAESSALTEREIENVIAATAEGYPFPCNLDLDIPVDAMVPESQQDLMRMALKEGWTPEKFEAGIAAQTERKRSH